MRKVLTIMCNQQNKPYTAQKQEMVNNNNVPGERKGLTLRWKINCSHRRCDPSFPDNRVVAKPGNSGSKQVSW